MKNELHSLIQEMIESIEKDLNLAEMCFTHSHVGPPKSFWIGYDDDRKNFNRLMEQYKDVISTDSNDKEKVLSEILKELQPIAKRVNHNILRTVF